MVDGRCGILEAETRSLGQTAKPFRYRKLESVEDLSGNQEPKINRSLWDAIEQKRLIRLRYKNRERVVEPHDYGIHKGVPKLFAFQRGGSSSHKLPNWRWMEENLISDIQLLDKTFAGRRKTRSDRHHEWDKLFIRVEPPDSELE